jgi:hypothetical protein
MDGITRVLLVHDILRRLFHAKSSSSEIGEDGYKAFKLDCGGLVVHDGAGHLGVSDIRLRVKAVMCWVKARLLL